MIFHSIKQGVNLTAIRRSFPRVDRFIQRYLLHIMAPKRHQNLELTYSKVAKRMALPGDRPDFMHAMLGKDTDGKEVGLILHDKDVTMQRPLTPT